MNLDSLHKEKETEMTRYQSLRHFEFQHPEKKKFQIAAQLGVRPSRYSQLRDPGYRPVLSDAEVTAISALLNQSASFVRKLYSRAA